MEIRLKPEKVVTLLSGVISLLIFANIVVVIAQHLFGYSTAFVINFFELNRENNLPTYFSSLQMIGCACLLGLIALLNKKQSRPYFWQWTGLCLLFLFLSIDEFTMIHEKISDITSRHLNPTGIFYFSWTIPYGIIALGLLAAYTPFILKIPYAIKTKIIVSGIVYVGGALGMELVGSAYFFNIGQRDLTYAIFTTIEESMEMFGILLFINALLLYIDKELSGVSLRITSSAKPNIPGNFTTRHLKEKDYINTTAETPYVKNTASL